MRYLLLNFALVAAGLSAGFISDKRKHIASEDTKSITQGMLSLSGGPRKKISAFTSKDVFIFFQSDCSACHALMKDLKCLAKKYNLVLLGSISDVEELKDTYKSYKVPYPAYYADPYTMAEIPVEVVGTPQIFRLTKPKPKLAMGLKPCKEYLPLLK